jgi:predicted dehydrogenase
LALFQPRSLDIDVVFDLMIHDLDVVLDCVGSSPEQISAVGVAVLSGNEDIANARLEFPDGCVANLTASRVSQERLRRIRFFQGDAYLSVDLFEKRADWLEVDAARLGPARGDLMAAAAAIRRERLPVEDGEPLSLELGAFLRSLRGVGDGAASARAGRAALAVAAEVRSAMQRRARQWKTAPSAAS